MKFDKQQSEYDLTELKLTHNFALKMASIITWSVVSSISIIGIFVGSITPISIGVLVAMIIVFGIITFTSTRNMALT